MSVSDGALAESVLTGVSAVGTVVSLESAAEEFWFFADCSAGDAFGFGGSGPFCALPTKAELVTQRETRATERMFFMTVFFETEVPTSRYVLGPAFPAVTIGRELYTIGNKR